MHASGGQAGTAAGAPVVPIEILVAGLQWDRAEDENTHDLDLSCVLLGADGCVLDVVHPGRPRNDNGSVVHTGDATTGAGSWDDERVFIFPDALPASVATAMFVVATASGHTLADIRNASCHVSNHETEEVLLHVALEGGRRESARCVASLVRKDAGWRLLADCPPELDGEALMPHLAAAACSKWQKGAPVAAALDGFRVR